MWENWDGTGGQHKLGIDVFFAITRHGCYSDGNEVLVRTDMRMGTGVGIAGMRY